MNRLLTLLCFVSFLFCAPMRGFAGAASEPQPDANPLKVGEMFPNLDLTGELNAEHARYLGVEPGKRTIKLGDLKAQILIVEFFSMYCPHCQAEAPRLNDLHRLTQDVRQSEVVKFIAVGAGNSEYEVDVFRKKFNLSYPMFFDPDFIAHKAVGEVGTPHYFVLRKDEPTNSHVIIESTLGCLTSPSRFLEQALKAAKAGAKPDKAAK